MTHTPLFYQSNEKMCSACGVHFYSPDVHRYKCDLCMSTDPYQITISPENLIKADKRYAELEDKVRILEEALEESEAELAYKEAQLNLALELAHKAHDLRVKLDSLQPYRDQPMLPFGDLPQ